MKGLRVTTLILLMRMLVARITTRIDALDGAYPPNTPDIPEITGPFTITVVARFDDIAGGSHQRLVDFGDGPITNNIILSQQRNTNNMRLKVWSNDGLGTTYEVRASNALTQGTTDTWEAGVDATGLMTIKKNGVKLAEAMGAVPLPSVRSQKLIGKSHWTADDDLIGAVLGLKVTNHNENQGFRQLEFLNIPAQVFGNAFEASVYARIDNLNGDVFDQRIFELGNGSDDVVTFSQYSNTTGIVLEVQQDSASYQCFATANSPLQVGEMALWRVQVTSTASMAIFRIEKNGSQLSECRFVGLSGLPKSVVRQNLFIGKSNSASSRTTQGVILGLRIDDNKM